MFSPLYWPLSQAINWELIKKEVVPMGRVELPRIAPYAPQAHVSTSSTTSAGFYFEGLPVEVGDPCF